MLTYLILYSSLTRAQQAAVILDRERIGNRLTRAPKAVSTQGCGHSIRLGQGDLARALSVLERMELSPRRVYVTAGEGRYEEVAL